MLAATPNKQRWTNWMMGVFLSRLLVFMGATAEVVSHCWTCFLSICVSVFLTCFLFCACAGVCVCVCVRLCFHGFRARYFMTYRRIFHAIAIVLLGNTTTVNYDAIHLKRWQWQGHIDAEGKLWHTKFCGARITICQNSLKIYDYGCF